MASSRKEYQKTLRKKTDIERGKGQKRKTPTKYEKAKKTEMKDIEANFAAKKHQLENLRKKKLPFQGVSSCTRWHIETLFTQILGA